MIAFRLVTLVGILGVTTSWAVSQTGVVNFNNANLILLGPPDRTVYMPDMMTPVIGSPTTEAPTFVAQLYYGANDASADSLQPVPYVPARFRGPLMSPAGAWMGGNRQLPGFTVGETVTLQVRAWDTGGIGLTYDEVRAAGGLWGDSALFTHLLEPDSTRPDAHYMHNFSGFSLVPEASTIALAAVGAFGLLLWIRRRQ